MVREDLKPSRIMTREAFDNAIRADMAIGGSTNAIIHLVAIAGRGGVELPLTRFDELSRTTPLLLNVKPSGKYLMEDFFYAGGLPVVLRELLPLLHRDALTVTGRAIAANNEGAVNYVRRSGTAEQWIEWLGSALSGEFQSLLGSREIPASDGRELTEESDPRPLQLSAACVHTGHYGTRSATLIVIPAASDAMPRVYYADGPPCTTPLQDASQLWSAERNASQGYAHLPKSVGRWPNLAS